MNTNSAMGKHDSELTVSGEIVIDDGYIWLLSTNEDILLKINKENNQLEKCYSFTDTPEYAGHYTLLSIDTQLIILPLYGKGIYLFDKTHESFVKLFTDNLEDENCSFIIAEVFSDEVLFVERNTNRFYIYSKSNSDNLIYLKDVECILKNSLETYGLKDAPNLFSSEHYRYGKKLCIPINNSNVFLIYDHDSKLITLYTLDTDDCIFSLGGAKDYLLFTTVDNRLIKWTESTTCELMDLNELIQDKCGTYKPVVSDDNIYLFPLRHKKIFYVRNNDAGRIDLDFLTTSCKYPENIYYQYTWIKLLDKKIYAQSRLNGDVFVINTVDNSVNIVRFTLPDEIGPQVLKLVMKHGNRLISEDDDYNLKNFISSV